MAEARLRCHAPARYDDVVRVATELAAVKSRSITFEYLITNADSGARLVTATTTLVSLDRDGHVTALPADVRVRLASAIP